MLLLISLGEDILIVSIEFESTEPEPSTVSAPRCIGFPDEVFTACDYRVWADSRSST